MTDCERTNRRGDPCELPAGWGTDHVGTGACRFHGGSSTGPHDTSKTKMNGTTHGARADPAGLFATLDDEREWVEAWADSWRKRAGLDEDDPTMMIIRMSAMRMYQAMSSEREVAKAGYYPTEYAIRYLSALDVYLVTLEAFEWFPAAE